MNKLSIVDRKKNLASMLVVLLVMAGLIGGATQSNASRAHASGTGTAAKYTFVVVLDGGHPELYNATNAPFLTSLKTQGASYTNAQAQAPADSITNIMGLFTGTDATHHGLPYETFWDRRYNHLIELDETPVLPVGITQDRNVGRVCTLFQSAKAANLKTAFISKYPAYDVLDGPSNCSVYGGVGIDNLQTPTFDDFEGTPQQYDQMNFETTRAQINAGSNRPNIFGLYAVAPNTMMKRHGINSAQVAQTIQFEDNQIAQTVALLKSVGIYNQTQITIVNDHGNTALTKAIPDHGVVNGLGGWLNSQRALSIDKFLNDSGIPTLQTTTDRVALVYLKYSFQAPLALFLLSLPQNIARFGIQGITPALGLGAYQVAPADRTPDFIVWPTDGSFGTSAVVYDTPPLSKQAEHGGRGAADQDIMIIMEGPGMQAGYTTNSHVWLMQVGTTMAANMCLPMPNATYAVLPGTSMSC